MTAWLQGGKGNFRPVSLTLPVCLDIASVPWHCQCVSCTGDWKWSAIPRCSQPVPSCFSICCLVLLWAGLERSYAELLEKPVWNRKNIIMKYLIRWSKPINGHFPWFCAAHSFSKSCPPTSDMPCPQPVKPHPPCRYPGKDLGEVVTTGPQFTFCQCKPTFCLDPGTN